ncbi:MAG TPA: bifunctional diaminohydroxyphosphoribosylaminopyrimidine deaminase/5-amino-6-(5-phosphoribosylamino)uracil reductase RibD [Candidatus Dormibacteraeota bacterium]|nr:bifunctional diaminohydroxyphosphoribosylaminopyrimidine deaminase/5-amino-6-(5-phosphoribosylamino)uracil reductase RibD [Candidatus Dormibacteraeota bacterium]
MISDLDRLFLDRTYELAARGIGNTAPNPPVGALVARDATVLGEGYHHRAGEAHAEVNALSQAGNASGATLYVSLEPCKHAGKTPPCTQAILASRVSRVVVGATDPTSYGGGAHALRERGVDVDVAGDDAARELVAIFAGSVERGRCYVALKMAMSLDGYVASRPGVAEWITSEEARLYVRDLRCAYDAVMVGAGTVRIDDPQLTVRPAAQRLRAFVRIVLCESEGVPADRRIFTSVPGYARTIVLAPAGGRARFSALESVADVLYVGDADDDELDLERALQALRTRGIASVLCEGGPTLAARLIGHGLVDKIYWAIAPIVLGGEAAVPVLAGTELDGGPRRLRFERLERVGSDAMLSGRFDV